MYRFRLHVNFEFHTRIWKLNKVGNSHKENIENLDRKLGLKEEGPVKEAVFFFPFF